VSDAPRDHFARLGLAPGFDVDAADLQRRYVALQRQLHPDRFATRPAAERALALARASDLNQAYEMLKAPLERAEYLLTLKGGRAGHTVDDPAMLMEAMELREALTEAESPDAVDALIARAKDDIAGVESELSAAFGSDDLDGARKLTQRLSYLIKLTQEARRRRLRLVNAVA
jgi:molecular chaperone HscB